MLLRKERLKMVTEFFFFKSFLSNNPAAICTELQTVVKVNELAERTGVATVGKKAGFNFSISDALKYEALCTSSVPECFICYNEAEEIYPYVLLVPVRICGRTAVCATYFKSEAQARRFNKFRRGEIKGAITVGEIDGFLTEMFKEDPKSMIFDDEEAGFDLFAITNQIAEDIHFITKDKKNASYRSEVDKIDIRAYPGYSSLKNYMRTVYAMVYTMDSFCSGGDWSIVLKNREKFIFLELIKDNIDIITYDEQMQSKKEKELLELCSFLSQCDEAEFSLERGESSIKFTLAIGEPKPFTDFKSPYREAEYIKNLFVLKEIFSKEDITAEKQVLK